VGYGERAVNVCSVSRDLELRGICISCKKALGIGDSVCGIFLGRVFGKLMLAFLMFSRDLMSWTLVGRYVTYGCLYPLDLFDVFFWFGENLGVDYLE